MKSSPYRKEKAIRAKLSLLYQFGITDRDKVCNHLSKAKNQTQLDNAVRQIISNYLNGDREFCKRKERQNEKKII